MQARKLLADTDGIESLSVSQRYCGSHGAHCVAKMAMSLREPTKVVCPKCSHAFDHDASGARVHRAITAEMKPFRPNIDAVQRPSSRRPDKDQEGSSDDGEDGLSLSPSLFLHYSSLHFSLSFLLYIVHHIIHSFMHQFTHSFILSILQHSSDI